jgi:hypothetical protein
VLCPRHHQKFVILNRETFFHSRYILSSRLHFGHNLPGKTLRSPTPTP